MLVMKAMKDAQQRGKLCSSGASPVLGSLEAVARWRPGLTILSGMLAEARLSAGIRVWGVSLR